MPYVNTRPRRAVPPILRFAPGFRGMGDDTSEFGDLSATLGGNTSVPITEPVYDLPVASGGLTPLDVNPLPVTTPVTTTTPSSNGFNLGNLFSSLANAAVAGQKIYLSTQTPSLVPGTNAIYNPATGQYYNPSTGQVVNAPGLPGSYSGSLLSGFSMGSLLPILLIAGVGIFALSALEHH